MDDEPGGSRFAGADRLAALLERRHEYDRNDDKQNDENFDHDLSGDDLEDEDLFDQARSRIKAPVPGDPGRPTTTYPDVPIDPVKQIRIVELQPGDYWEPLQCRLEDLTLQHEQPESTTQGYEALSYTWGGWTNFESITLAEVDEFPITCNLHSALKRLRKSTESRKLWIDQLSIDQGDEHEKERQIAMMGSIFREAAQVIIWLGDAPDEDLGRPITNGFLRSQLKYVITWNQPCWSTRTWVLQEFAMAKVDPLVCFGSHELEWSELFLLLVHPKLLISGSKLLQFAIQISNMTEIRKKPGTWSMLTLAWTIRQMGSSILQDKIFSILPLLPADVGSRIEVDYNKPTAMLFAETTFAALTSRTGLATLVLASRNQSRGSDLPSWAIDFGSKIMPMTARIAESTTARSKWYPLTVSRRLTHAFDHHMLASEWRRICKRLQESTEDVRPWCRQHPQVVTDVSFDPKEKTLRLRAIQFDDIAYVAPQKDDSNAVMRAFNQTQELLGQHSDECMSILANARSHLMKQGLGQAAYTHCPSCGKSFSSSEVLAHIWRWEAATMPAFFKRQSTAVIDSHLCLGMETMINFFNYGAFVTKCGFLALGPFGLNVDDSIVLPHGSRFPFALRRVNTGGWIFLGFIYVFGIMQGELMGDEFQDLQLAEADYLLH